MSHITITEERQGSPEDATRDSSSYDNIEKKTRELYFIVLIFFMSLYVILYHFMTKYLFYMNILPFSS